MTLCLESTFPEASGTGGGLGPSEERAPEARRVRLFQARIAPVVPALRGVAPPLLGVAAWFAWPVERGMSPLSALRCVLYHTFFSVTNWGNTCNVSKEETFGLSQGTSDRSWACYCTITQSTGSQSLASRRAALTIWDWLEMQILRPGPSPD